MAYTCELGSGQSVYLDNQGTQTIVTTISGGLGQQQQSSSSFSTGPWTAPPSFWRTAQGIVIQIDAAQGTHYIQVQGTSIQVMSHSPGLEGAQFVRAQQASSIPNPSAQPMQPMSPIPPMQPMKMGGMHLNMNPMEMRMGNMHMRMGETRMDSPSTTKTTARFCSSCGASIKPSDRFCSSCGNRLSP